jgi:TonB family protein
MNTLHSRLSKQLTVAALSLLLGLSAAANENSRESWPETVVKIEDLKSRTAFQLRVPSIVVKGRITGPAILRAHVSEQGEITKATLLESCGNADMDEASLHALRATKFEPYRVNGVPAAVTLVLPVHLPAKFGRQH